MGMMLEKYELRENCPYSQFFWSVFSRIRTEYGDLQIKSLYPVRMRENKDQENSEYGQFSSSGVHCKSSFQLQDCLSMWDLFGTTRH